MKKIVFYFICCICFGGSLSAQSVEFEKDNFPGRKEELRVARRQLDIGIEFYLQGRKEFDDFVRGYMSFSLIKCIR